MMDQRNKLMRCDIRENDKAYVLDLELPGCARDKIKAYVEKGYLIVQADLSRETTGKALHTERFTGTCERRIYVGDISTSDIAAAYRNGILTLTIPKEAYRKAAEAKKIIIG